MFPSVEMRLLEAVIVLAEELNFTRSSHGLHTQSALSRQITEIEEQLRVRLFTRDNRRVARMELTDAERVFVEEARSSLLHTCSRGWSLVMSEPTRKPAESSHALHAISGLSPVAPIDLASEKHYSVIEIAKLWALSEKTVRKIFEREPGVIHWCTEEKLHKRGYRTLRVPETILYRVHRKLRRAS